MNAYHDFVDRPSHADTRVLGVFMRAAQDSLSTVIKVEEKKMTEVVDVDKIADIAAEKIKAKEEAKAKQLTAVESTIAKLKATYNDATIVEGTSGAYSNPYSRRDWINYPTVTVTLANGVKVVYRIYSDGSLGRLEITFPNQKDAYSLLSALNTI
jgi:hypothetical protein